MEALFVMIRGSRLMVVALGVFIFAVEQVRAQTWIPTSAPSANWESIVCSSNGARLAAVIYQGAIYTSSNSGASWNSSSAPAQPWVSIAGSADGSQLIAAALYTGVIYRSADFGSTWSADRK